MRRPPPNVRIRALAAGEVELLRSLRLAALADSPDSFGELYTDAAALPEAEWAARAARLVEPNGPRMFIAVEGDDYLGTVFALHH